MSEVHIYPVTEQLKVSAAINADTYQKLYRQSIEAPDIFWAGQARQFLSWVQPWSIVSKSKMEAGEVAWFIDGKLNAAANCIDRHLPARANQIAIIWEGDSPEDERHISYQELHDEVCKLANVLRARGVKKSDRVCIYMPMIPEAAYAILACARVGAVHSVVFGGFSPDALKDRILDADCQIIITADEGLRGGRRVPLKNNVDAAIVNCPDVHTCLVVRRTGGCVNWNHARDVWYHDAIATQPPVCTPEIMDAEDPLFILYTSGSTGKPKGILHTTAGYLLQATMTHKYVFDYRDGEIYWCTADVGWVTGHRTQFYCVWTACEWRNYLDV